MEIKPENFFGLVYRSKQMAEVADLIQRAAPESATVLILGESGTGKELAAKAIHTLSKRKEKILLPLTAVLFQIVFLKVNYSVMLKDHLQEP
jgi:DNA-binding NtrC family response regulator